MTKKKEEFDSIIKEIKNNSKFNKLKKELHHGISRYDHSYRVANWTYKACKLLRIKDIEDTTKAALLHDFYVDDDLINQSSVKRLNTHPNMALENSLKYFSLTEMQKDIIKNHMFPCTLNCPKFKESWLVSAIDKTVSIYEMIRFKMSLYMGIYLLFTYEIIKIQR